MHECKTRRCARSSRGDRKTRWRPIQEQAWAFLAGGECGISVRFVRFYARFRIWVTGRPVFRRKGHVPEHRIGQHELYSHLRMIALMAVNVCDNTLQCSFCLDVRQSESLASVHLHRHENQWTVTAYGPRLSLCFKRAYEG